MRLTTHVPLLLRSSKRARSCAPSWGGTKALLQRHKFRNSHCGEHSLMWCVVWKMATTSQIAWLCLLRPSCWFLGLLILRPWRWRRHFPAKYLLTFNGLHSVIFPKIEFYVTSQPGSSRMSNADCYKESFWIVSTARKKRRNGRIWKNCRRK
jgi:hypothetical protein